jgi:SM-20-related protein
MQSSQIDAQTDWPATDFSRALDDVANAHYAVIPHFLSQNMQQALKAELLQQQDTGSFHAAGIGRGLNHAQNTKIRGDSICWLEPTFSAGALYLERMAELRQQLNQQFFLGLQSYEAHYAHYQTGSHYQRHVDRHQSHDARVISSVCYLNDDWPADAGGELQLFNANNELLLTLPPTGGTLVLFMSADMPHEVLAAQRSRYSIAGWFRRD